MRTRKLTLGLFADEQGLAWVRALVEDAAGARSARIVSQTVTIADGYDYLAQQWAVEHPAQGGGARQLIELRVHLACSLRSWRATRKTVIETLCPEGTAPHTCRVPWSAA
ncbi:hypothetical protein ABT237_37470 [Streptomyces sp. NPDC001581]|uniref:hypothetical protein n=1 Tax=Streptomyces sp. NPDC001581 TaxID=3154386 RepID=UPI00331C3E2D